MKVIKANIEHLDSVYKLVCELESECFDKDTFSQIYQANLNNKEIHYLVAVEELDIVGFASLHVQKLLHHYSKIGEIQEIIIAKNNNVQVLEQPCLIV